MRLNLSGIPDRGAFLAAVSARNNEAQGITSSKMSKQTPLYQTHVDASGKMVDFAGWQLPIHYGSVVEEHKAVRSSAGMFDVSHMTVVDVRGEDAQSFLRKLLANDVAKLTNGKALYSCMCNERGQVLDDLIVYKTGDGAYRLVVNAATRDKDLAWMTRQQSGEMTIDTPEGHVIMAVQGPEAMDKARASITSINPEIASMFDGLERFAAIEHGNWFIGRTGYTGEDGVEIVLPENVANKLWHSLLDNHVAPAGLGARDTLRLEAGMHLYGQDLDEEHTAIESGLGWTVDITDSDREFIGRETLQGQKESGASYSFTGVVLEGRGVLRRGQTVQLAGDDVGNVTSGTFSPSLQKSIGMVRSNKPIDGVCDVIIRDKVVAAKAVKLPFYKNGKATIS